MYPSYYNRVWEVKSVPTTTTIELEGFAVGHPMQSVMETLISQNQNMIYLEVMQYKHVVAY